MALPTLTDYFERAVAAAKGTFVGVLAEQLGAVCEAVPDDEIAESQRQGIAGVRKTKPVYILTEHARHLVDRLHAARKAAEILTGDESDGNSP